jgi:hypothetical protein
MKNSVSEKQQSKKPVSEKLLFDEVEVRRLNPVKEGNKLITKFERHKVLRSNVRITQYQADVLNEGRIVCDHNVFFVLYLLPGQEVEDWVREIS